MRGITTLGGEANNCLSLEDTCAKYLVSFVKPLFFTDSVGKLVSANFPEGCPAPSYEYINMYIISLHTTSYTKQFISLSSVT